MEISKINKVKVSLQSVSKVLTFERCEPSAQQRKMFGLEEDEKVFKSGTTLVSEQGVSKFFDNPLFECEIIR